MGEHAVERVLNLRRQRAARLLFLEDRLEASSAQKRVLLAQGYIESVCQAQHHLFAGARSSGFKEAHVAGGNIGSQGKVELAETSPLAPILEQGCERTSLPAFFVHVWMIGASRQLVAYLSGN